MKNAVVIVIYKDNPSDAELASFRQCVTVLKAHKFCIVAPKTLVFDVYASIIDSAFVTYEVICFENSWFQSVHTYNKLMLSTHFYEKFVEFDYILLYQLDAWVCSDQLNYWCNAGYTYIGAPWFSDRGEIFPYAGNGGFSLRKISAFMEILTKRNYSNHQWNWPFLTIQHPAKNPFRARVKKILHHMSMFFCWFSPQLFIKFNRDFEDITFAKAFSLSGSAHVAPPHIAAHFSFERFPEKLYEITGHQLPFGCHAFAKHNWDFWKDTITVLDTNNKD